MRVDITTFLQEGDEFIVEHESGAVMKYKIIDGAPKSVSQFHYEQSRREKR